MNLRDLRHTWLAVPTLFRTGIAENVAYRGEFFVWMLTTTMPLVMLALWTSVSSEAPFAGFDTAHFTAYYLGTMIVRNMTGNWVAWQLSEEIRGGILSIRLLKPVHPLIVLGMSHLAAIPLRALFAVPFALILLFSNSQTLLIRSPLALITFVLALAGAWLLNYLIFALLGSLGMFMQKSDSVVDVYFAVYSIASGYLIPLPLLPEWTRTISDVLPFRYLIGYPVELLIGLLPTDQLLTQLGIQWLWVVVLGFALRWVWNRGLYRYEAFGG